MLLLESAAASRKTLLIPKARCANGDKAIDNRGCHRQVRKEESLETNEVFFPFERAKSKCELDSTPGGSITSAKDGWRLT